MTRWAVSGGSGFLGLAVARRLVVEGVAVRALDPEPLPAGLAGVDSIEGDVRNPADAARLRAGADVVVHAAAALPVRRSEAEIRSVTVDGTAVLLAAARETGVRRVVYVSSAVVYGLPSELPLTETSPAAPFEPYGRAKLAAEGLCREFGRRGLEVVVLRPTAFIGPGRLGVFGILFAWIRDWRRIYVLGRGENRSRRSSPMRGRRAASPGCRPHPLGRRSHSRKRRSGTRSVPPTTGTRRTAGRYGRPAARTVPWDEGALALLRKAS